MSEEKRKESNFPIEFAPIIIGTMRLGEWGSNLTTEELEKFIDACVDMSFNDFDHADIYGHYTEEQRFGEVIKRRPDLKSKIQITTKSGIRLITPNRPKHQVKSYDATKAHIISSAEHSLKQLGVDVLDVLLLHRPDFLMNVHEVAEAAEQLKKEGKIKTFGVSNFSYNQFEVLNSCTPLVTNQLEISLLHRNAFEDARLDQCMKYGISPTAWSPFAGGTIFSKTTDADLLRIQKVLQELGEIYNASADQILLAFLLKHPSGIIPILGSTKIARIETAKAALDISLSREDWYKLWESAIGQEVA